MLGTNSSYWHVKQYNWICEGPTCVHEDPNLIEVKAIITWHYRACASSCLPKFSAN